MNNLTPTANSAPMDIAPPRKPILPILLTILFLLALAATIILAIQNWQLNQRLNALSATPTPTPSLTPTPTTDPTANWKIVTRKNWSLKAPNTWSYLECSDELLFVGPSISQDQTTECAFDGSPGVIQLVRATGDSDRSISTNTNPAFDPYVSETSELSLDGKKAVKQQETIKDGPGAGIRIYVYINQPDYMDIIILHDITQKEVFDQILSTFKFLNKADEGTLQATVIRSPTCAGPATDEEGCEGPYANGKFQIKKLSNGEIVQTVTTDKNGALTVSLASGTYTLQNIETGIGKRISNSNFTITSGETTIQRFDVDTGIR